MDPTTLVLYGLSIICLLPYIHLVIVFLIITLSELSYNLSKIITKIITNLITNLLDIVCSMIFYCPFVLLAVIYLITALI